MTADRSLCMVLYNSYKSADAADAACRRTVTTTSGQQYRGVGLASLSDTVLESIGTCLYVCVSAVCVCGAMVAHWPGMPEM